MSQAALRRSIGKTPLTRRIVRALRQYWPLYAMIIPGLLYFLVYKYIPMFGIHIAFKNFSLKKGIAGSPWLWNDGKEWYYWFERFFKSPANTQIIGNTLVISIGKLIVQMIPPLIFALAISETCFKRYARVIQTVSYLPHFLSWVIISGITMRLFATNDGIVNKLLGTQIPFMGTDTNWRASYIILGIWKECGWNTIIYLAALTGINPELYEAAEVDGASRWRKIWHITLPGIRSTIIVLLIMNLGHILGSEFDRPFTLRNKMVSDAYKTISIFVYERGVKGGQFSLSTAVGLFQSVVCVIFLLLSNTLAKRFGERGIW